MTTRESALRTSFLELTTQHQIPVTFSMLSTPWRGYRVLTRSELMLQLLEVGPPYTRISVTFYKKVTGMEMTTEVPFINLTTRPSIPVLSRMLTKPWKNYRVPTPFVLMLQPFEVGTPYTRIFITFLQKVVARKTNPLIYCTYFGGADTTFYHPWICRGCPRTNRRNSSCQPEVPEGLEVWVEGGENRSISGTLADSPAYDLLCFPSPV